MSQKIKISDSIATQIYNFEKDNSRSYIIDEKYCNDLMLEGYSSDIWAMILKTQDYNMVYEYARKKGLAEELDDFLSELVEQNLIEYSNIKNQKENFIDKKNDEVNLNGHSKAVSCGGFEDEDIYTEERTKWLYENNFLQYLAIQTNYKCNLRCAHCFNEKECDNVQLSYENIQKVVDQAYELGITTVGLTGGECTIHKDFYKIISYIRKKRLSLIFITNGQKLYDDKDLFEKVVSLYPHRIKLSLYSMEEEVHDNITGVKGSYKKTIDVIKRLRENNILVTINFLQLMSNYGSYPKVVEFGKSIGARTDVALHFINNPKNHNFNLRIHGEALENLYKDKDFPNSVYNMKLMGFKKDNRTVCRASEIVLSVSPFYTVTPCNDFNYSLGSLYETSLIDIWNNVVPEFRNKFLRSNMTDCGDKEYCRYCSYCPMRALYENGFMKRSNAGCEHAIAYYNALKEISHCN